MLSPFFCSLRFFSRVRKRKLFSSLCVSYLVSIVSKLFFLVLCSLILSFSCLYLSLSAAQTTTFVNYSFLKKKSRYYIQRLLRLVYIFNGNRRQQRDFPFFSLHFTRSPQRSPNYSLDWRHSCTLLCRQYRCHWQHLSPCLWTHRPRSLQHHFSVAFAQPNRHN